MRVASILEIFHSLLDQCLKAIKTPQKEQYTLISTDTSLDFQCEMSEEAVLLYCDKRIPHWKFKLGLV